LIPITEVPGFIRAFAGREDLGLNQPQRRHLEEYLTGLMVCDNHTVSAMNDWFTGHRDQSAKNHFLTESGWDEQKLEKARNSLIMEEVKKRNVHSGALIFDDTLIHKTGKEIPDTGKFYDHGQGSYVHGQQIVTSQFACKYFHVPLDFEIYRKKEEAPEEDFQSKLELFQGLFEKAQKRRLPFTVALMDSWYFCKETADFLGVFPYVAAAKSTLQMHTATGPVSLADYAASLPAEAFKKVEIETAQGHKRTFLYFTKCVKLTKVGQVRLVISYDSQREKSEPKFLVTNQLGWEIRRILWEYTQRWFIERFYQEAKQHLGLEECEMRRPTGIQRHYRLVFLADTLLQLNALVGPLTRWFKGNVQSLAGKCSMVKTEVVRSFISWTLRQAYFADEVDFILTKAFAPQSEPRITFAD
jgi:SRSO17 transposase